MNPENVIVKYATNLSIFPNDETIELWKKFKKVILNVSIDGVGEKFEYVRWPLQWHQIDNNLKKLKQLKNQNDINLVYHIAYTGNPLTIWYLDELENYSQEHFQEHDNLL